jgi:hypothetical protein
MKIVPEEIEVYRDTKWRRFEALKVENALQAESMIEDMGFCLTLTDSRTVSPSIYIAVCGRRDVHTPKNVQKDIETSLAWVLKDEVFMRGKVFYGKVCKSRSMFIAKRLIPHFRAIYGASDESLLSDNALLVLRVLRQEWEMATSDLRTETGIEDRKSLTKALEELQKKMIVIPSEVLYQPKFTYIWTISEARFPKEMAETIDRKAALTEIARQFLNICGLTLLGDLAKFTGLTRKECGLANHKLVEEGFAVRLATGIYKLSTLKID